MDLRNLFEGNQRGQFRVNRQGTFAKAFFGFLRRCGFCTRGFTRDDAKGKRLAGRLRECQTPGFALENDVFLMRPYDWNAECTCGFDDALSEWAQNARNQHSKRCYQTKLKERQQAVVASYGVDALHKITPHERYREAYAKHNQVMYALARRMGLPEFGCGVHCTCSVERRLNRFQQLLGGGHKADCRSIQPNFRHKASGFELHWYKYPLRAANTNVRITVAKFALIATDCLNSVSS